MSFFNEFLDILSVDDLSEKTTISIVVGHGLMIVGKIKILNLSEENLKVSSGKDVIEISGSRLTISSISKGELIVAGEIKGFSVVEGNGK